MNRSLFITPLLLAGVFTACSDSIGPVERSTPQFSSTGALNGAIYTSVAACNGVNQNVYPSKDSVYLNGGPRTLNAAGLSDGWYYVQVTEPNGALLGTSVGTGNEQPVHVTNGRFDQCYHLSSVVEHSGTPGFLTTTNAGGEYKVWVSTVADFAESSSRTDNFKVAQAPILAELNVLKFYDANANGVKDGAEQFIAGWEMLIEAAAGGSLVRYTDVSVLVSPGSFTVTESAAVESNWFATTANPQTKDVGTNGETFVFGNVCVGAGGGHTLGFWSNKNGGSLYNVSWLAGLTLRNANGSVFTATSNHTVFKNWILAATATNMANMLSAQAAAMKLNVGSGMVSASAMVYAPGVPGINTAGFISIADLLAAAQTQLSVNGLTTAANDPTNRAIQSVIKDALDKANNNLNFAQSTPCAFSFAGI